MCLCRGPVACARGAWKSIVLGFACMLRRRKVMDGVWQEFAKLWKDSGKLLEVSRRLWEESWTRWEAQMREVL